MLNVVIPTNNTVFYLDIRSIVIPINNTVWYLDIRSIVIPTNNTVLYLDIRSIVIPTNNTVLYLDIRSIVIPTNNTVFYLDIRTILQNGGTILNAEGYMWEFGRRGYLKYGAYTPEVVLEHPNLVESMHREFVHAGSDVVQAFTYFGHREKLKSVGREDDLETLNRTALRLARKVADDTDKIMAAGICNTGIWDPDNETTKILARKMFKEQVEWAVEEKADYIIGETYNDSGEAMAALETIKEYGKGKHLYPNDLESVRCNSADIREFAKESKRIGVQYIGLCCGNCSALFRELAESYNRKPPASKYAPDLSLSSVFGEPSGKKYGRADKIRAFMLNLKY
ncbi:BHMT [Mytilus coruscus]|uniref:BHMT n=1 Tax=Mytilus coruscus TaxID=42192 RepID=A0A6J8EIU1_MYTCO|nr:BHMT [Mytilus coruscus]